ncbi:MAG: two-component system, OmpR family, sensor histidine kinase KdpD [Gammaproteobacteria bacterium]|nr:two-component system, OmpR family, sensor histidine kinase KdpD [Gammaproteobacteria bacterium]
MIDQRPDPDQLLAHVQAEEARAKRGRLRIFFGASAGVGKTFAMLEAAHTVRTTNPATDVVVGYIEPHGRADTERLLEGLELLPTLAVKYRGIVRQEFDLDAALARRPGILLVDELAHSNVIGGEPAPRHPKRWQDIEELLEAGITVWTTVNVQHLESLNDLVAQITGIRQRETLPDRVFDEADDIELIDLPPDDLLARLHAGKVYVAGEVATAVERFFRTPNLMALRELALRRVADRVEAAARALPSNRGRGRFAGDRILVAVGPDEQAEQLVRAGKRMADALDAGWIVVYVETPALLSLSESERDRRIDVLRLAESLGAEAVTLDGPSVAATLVEYAQTRNATRVIVGSAKRKGWWTWFQSSTSAQLINSARGFDVITIATAGEPGRRAGSSGGVSGLPTQIKWDRYAWGVVTTAACTAVAFVLYPRFELSNLVMVYLLGVTLSGLRFGRGPSVLVSLLNVAAFDFFFVPPRYTFAITDGQYIVTFAVMLIIALVIASLMASIRQQTRVAGARERRTALLYAMSRELAATRGLSSLAQVAVSHVAEVFQCKAVILLPDATGKLRYPRDPRLDVSFRRADLAVAQWVVDHGQRAGLGSDTLAATPGLYLPLGDERQRLGVLAVRPGNQRRVLLPEQRHLLETFAGQIGLALERARLAEAAEAASLDAERESLRNTLLASISHDLRTPLAVMAGAGSTLADRGASLDEATRVSLARSIEVKAREMSDLVSNVLDLMRFESGQVLLRTEWETLDDLVGTALNAVEQVLKGHSVDLRLPADLPPVFVDAKLVVQVFTNLFDNIAKYTPAGTHLIVSAAADGKVVRVMVDDDGPGLPPGDPARLFDKFQRGDEEGAIVGVGLGLAICQAIIRAHGGQIEAHRRSPTGARFEFTLPAANEAATATEPPT